MNDMQLTDGEIHVWSYALDRAPEEIARLVAVLSDGERARAASFHFPRDRARFEVARTRLRQLLAGYLDCGPAELVFGTGAHGKPTLEQPAAGNLRFNLSHSYGQALLAVARGCELGIDLEQIRSDVDFEGIVDSHFSTREKAAWTALPIPQQTEGFFHGWVRKEAYVKARGEGLMRDGARYSVSVAPAGPAALLEDTLAPGAEGHWCIDPVPAPAGFAAAVAYSGACRRIVMRAAPGATDAG
jgi:4'-phosphopantetheinyl transferase